MAQDEKEFRIRVMAAGYEVNELDINAMPDCIVIHGDRQRKQPEPGELIMTELGGKKMFRRLELPSPLDPEKVTATLVNGMLTIVAPKAAPAKEKKIFVTASHAT
jgi:HSP20 family protein